MKRSNFLMTLTIATLFLLSCFGKRMTFDKDNKIGSLGRPNKIEYYKNLEGEAFKYKTEPEFALTEIVDIEDAMQEIKDANKPEPRKGAGWDKIIISYSDTIIKINTNKRKIGLSASGSFYDLDKNNFITKKLKE